MVPSGLSNYENFDEENNSRLGVACGLLHCSYILPNNEIIPIFEFLISKALRDPVNTVADEMVNAGLNIIYEKGKDNQEALLKFFGKLKIKIICSFL